MQTSSGQWLSERLRRSKWRVRWRCCSNSERQRARTSVEGCQRDQSTTTANATSRPFPDGWMCGFESKNDESSVFENDDSSLENDRALDPWQ